MSEKPKSGDGAQLEPWETPELRKIGLSDEEVAALRASHDPMALLLEMKPELRSKKAAS